MVDQIKFKSLSFIGLAVLLASLLACCKDEDKDQECFDASNPDCENYDPCYGVEEPSAEFYIEDLVYDPIEHEFSFLPEEGLFKGSEIRFRSEFNNSGYSHIWYIGTDEYYEPSVEIDFSDVPRPNTITISHVLEYPVDSTCFPLSTGRDSVTMSFDLMDYWNELKTMGTFRGVIEGQVDTFKFRIFALQYLNGIPARWSDGGAIDFYRVNMHNQADSAQFLTAPSFTNHQFIFEFSSGPAQGIMQVDMDSDSVRMEYTWEDGEDYVFNGVVVE